MFAFEWFSRQFALKRFIFEVAAACRRGLFRTRSLLRRLRLFPLGDGGDEVCYCRDLAVSPAAHRAGIDTRVHKSQTYKSKSTQCKNHVVPFLPCAHVLSKLLFPVVTAQLDEPLELTDLMHAAVALASSSTHTLSFLKILNRIVAEHGDDIDVPIAQRLCRAIAVADDRVGSFLRKSAKKNENIVAI